MKKLLVILALIIIAVVIYLTIVNNLSNGKLVVPSVTPLVFQAKPESDDNKVDAPDGPKTFKFDRNTDLNAELEKIDPKVLDSDFE